MRALVNFISGAVLGSLVGATLALLLAPESGPQLRNKIQSRVSQIELEIRQAAADRRAEMEQQLEELRAPRY